MTGSSLCLSTTLQGFRSPEVRLLPPYRLFPPEIQLKPVAS